VLEGDNVRGTPHGCLRGSEIAGHAMLHSMGRLLA
jgi:hypothetical protein